MENFDPLGIHTGESIVVAPIVSLTKEQIKMLEEIAIKVVRHIRIVGECNIQYAFNAETNDYRIIEINARLSRSSALASKASGYPLAFVVAKLALGYTLDQIGEMGTPNSAYVAPSVDYMIVKIPRWDLYKVCGRGSRDWLVDEICGRNNVNWKVVRGDYPERSPHDRPGMHGFVGNNDLRFDDLDKALSHPTDLRIFAIARALEEGYTVERIEELTKIDKWFIERLANIVRYKGLLSTYNKIEDLPKDVLKEAKRLGFSDFQIARFVEDPKGIWSRMCSELESIVNLFEVLPRVRRINTVASEYPDLTNYLYVTYGRRECHSL